MSTAARLVVKRRTCSESGLVLVLVLVLVLGLGSESGPGPGLRVRARVRVKVRARGREAARHLHDLGLRGLADGDHIDAALPQPAGAEPP